MIIYIYTYTNLYLYNCYRTNKTSNMFNGRQTNFDISRMNAQSRQEYFFNMKRVTDICLPLTKVLLYNIREYIKERCKIMNKNKQTLLFILSPDIFPNALSRIHRELLAT